MKLKLTIDGKLYEVDVEVDESDQPHPSYIPPTAQPAAAPSATPSERASAGETVADESKVCRSPISGIVVRVSAQVGQSIREHDVEITSPVDGKIAKVNAAVGDSVRGQQVLVEFD